ncbi:MAG: FAD-binding protein [Dehalococcoidia bacterium]|nr:FAD-binding protein [Dehalococcoidia bacterium]
MYNLTELGESISTEVLVLGGGIAGCFAAIKAREAGLDVTLVDKGYVGRGGESHQMSGVLTCFDPEQDNYDAWFRECVEASQWVADQHRLDGMIYETRERIRDLENWGATFQKENGKFIRRAGVGHYYARNVVMTRGGFQLMSAVRGEVIRQGVHLIQRVMVTDLLTSDGELPTGGKVVGAIGFDLVRGKFYVFKAKTVIITTGSTRAIAPRLTMPNLSGDGKGMAFRAGCEMRNVELALASLNAVGFNCASGENILVGEGAFFVNARGERFMQKWDPQRVDRAPRAVLTLAMAIEEKEGRGPIYLDATQLSESAYYRIEKAIPIVVGSFDAGGVSLRENRIPYTPAIHDHGPGGIRVDKHDATTLSGLFAAGAASDHAESGASNVIGHGMLSAIGGYRAGVAASRYASGSNEPQLNRAQVERLKKLALAPMERKSLFSHGEVRWELKERLWGDGLLGPLRTESKLKKAIGIIEEAKAEKLPGISARDYHELARVLGLANELLYVELLARCALLRTESRGSHYREDYPQRDDVNWLKWVIAKTDGKKIAVWAERIPFDEYPLKPQIS